MSQADVGRCATTGQTQVVSRRRQPQILASALVLGLATVTVSAQPLVPTDQQVENLTGSRAIALALQLRNAAAVHSANEKCTLGFIYAHTPELANMANAALAHYFLSACFVLEGVAAPAFAVAHAEQLDTLYRQVSRRLQASVWSEVTLTSNVSGELITLAGWADTDLRTPASIWLPAGTYRATFEGDQQAHIDTFTREFVVEKSHRGVVMVEHYIPPAASQGPVKTVSVDFAEEQPEASTPTVVIDNKHKNLVPDRFLQKNPGVDLSHIIEDPLAQQPQRIAGPGAWTLGVAAGFGAHFDATARTRLGAGAAVIANFAISQRLAFDVRSGFASSGGSAGMNRTANAWSLAAGLRWQFTDRQRQATWHPFVGVQLGGDVRGGSRDAASVGATLAAEAGLMVGPAQRFGVAITVIRGLTELEQSAATGISLQVRARVW